RRGGRRGERKSFVCSASSSASPRLRVQCPFPLTPKNPDNVLYSVSQSTQPAVIHSAVREQLDKILAHRLFSRSARMARFLRFAVDHSLSGHADELTEYVIAVDVFDRSDSCDPGVEPF